MVVMHAPFSLDPTRYRIYSYWGPKSPRRSQRDGNILLGCCSNTICIADRSKQSSRGTQPRSADAAGQQQSPRLPSVAHTGFCTRPVPAPALTGIDERLWWRGRVKRSSACGGELLAPHAQSGAVTRAALGQGVLLAAGALEHLGGVLVPCCS